MTMTNHIMQPGLTLMAGWPIPANDNEPCPRQIANR